MAYPSSATPKTCVLRVNFHGPACEKKVHKLLRKINGVSSIMINGENGRVSVSGMIEPCTLIIALEKIGKKAELLWEDSAPINYATPFMHQASQAQAIDPEDWQQYSQNEHVKQVKFTKCVKVKFKDHEDEFTTHKRSTINIDIDDAHGPKKHHHHHHHASSSDCHQGSHHGHATEKNGSFDHFHGENLNSDGFARPHRCGGPPGPPPPVSGHQYSPCPQQYSSPPFFDHSYPGFFSDDNPHGCTLM